MSIRKQLASLWFYSFFSLALASGADAVGSPIHEKPAIRHHHLVVELIPATHELVAKDTLELAIDPQALSVTFSLAPTLRVESVAAERSSGADGQRVTREILSFAQTQLDHYGAKYIVVTLPKNHGPHLTLTWDYRGPINDPPQEPRHLRFVTPSETSGHIGEEGVYLSSESQWYPDIAGAFSTYQITARMPQGWTMVAPGHKETETTSAGNVSATWVIQEPSEAVTLVANRFVTKSRPWKGPAGQQVELLTYFFPDNAGLADEYLDATAKYLDAYVRILGDYPFEKFAVVENFFASGLGMPSFTLLGSGSIKRHYVQPYALGHEIVHSWIGNSVFNRDDHGNWVEGLTTYLANYYWHELTQDLHQAREQRRLMLHGYSLYVRPEQDYAVAEFLRKHDEKDNAIGYQKSAFVFHLLRREIGDEAFWRALKIFVSRYRNQPADWGAIETVFAQESRRDLRWFFEQWVERPGAPSLSLGAVHAHQINAESSGDRWRLTVQVQQAGKPFRAMVPITIVMKNGVETRWMPMSLSSSDTAQFTIPSQPMRVELDPDLMVFRRVMRSHLPPMLNSYVTDPRKTVVKAFADPTSPLQGVVARMADPGLPASQHADIQSLDGHAISRDGSVLFLVGPEQVRAAQSLVQQSCADRVVLKDAGFQIDGQVYEGPKLAVLFSCHRHDAPGSVITILYGVTAEAVARVSRLLFYYGWHSYVIFQDGTVMKRELWQETQDVKEVRVDAR